MRIKYLIGLVLPLFVAVAQADSVVLMWDKSPDTNVVGYHVYFGVFSGSYTNHVTVGDTNYATVTTLVPGTSYYFVATAFVPDGTESLPSNEVQYDIPDLPPVPPPNAPTNLTIVNPVFLTRTVTPTNSGHVMVTPDKSGGAYVWNETVTLTAVPTNGFQFLSWSGDVADTDNPLTLSLTGHKTVTAIFFQDTPPPCMAEETTNVWNRLLEGFEDHPLAWTNIGTVTNITYNADSSALNLGKPPGACDTALRIVVPTNAVHTYTYTSLDSSIDVDTNHTLLSFSLYVEKAPERGKGYKILSWRTSTNFSASLGCSLFNRSTTGLAILPEGQGATGINIASNQWYTVVLDLDLLAATNASTMSVYSTNALIGVDDFTRYKFADMRYIFLGPCYALHTNDSGTVWFDLLSVKTEH